jgi:hypothetical protein
MNQTEAVFEIEEALVTKCKSRVEPDGYILADTNYGKPRSRTPDTS